MYGIFIYITGEDKDKLLSSGLICRGCGQLQGVFPKCSDLTFGNVLGILCARGLEVRVVRGRSELDSPAVFRVLGNKQIQCDPHRSPPFLMSFVFFSD